jgi:hypothetical protein
VVGSAARSGERRPGDRFGRRSVRMANVTFCIYDSATCVSIRGRSWRRSLPSSVRRPANAGTWPGELSGTRRRRAMAGESRVCRRWRAARFEAGEGAWSGGGEEGVNRRPCDRLGRRRRSHGERYVCRLYQGKRTSRSLTIPGLVPPPRCAVRRALRSGPASRAGRRRCPGPHDRGASRAGRSGGRPLGVARQAVVGDRLPLRRVGGELPEHRAHARIAVEGAHPDAGDRAVGLLREHG